MRKQRKQGRFLPLWDPTQGKIKLEFFSMYSCECILFPYSDRLELKKKKKNLINSAAGTFQVID